MPAHGQRLGARALHDLHFTVNFYPTPQIQTTTVPTMAKDQTEMAGDGFDQPKIKAIDDAAAEYVNVRNRRMKLTETETEAKEALIQACKKNAEKLLLNKDGDRVYRFDEEVVVLSEVENVKVKSFESYQKEMSKDK